MTVVCLSIFFRLCRCLFLLIVSVMCTTLTANELAHVERVITLGHNNGSNNEITVGVEKRYVFLLEKELTTNVC